ncbi:MAG: hypothetical protein R3F43_14115 [bacterium]
MLPGSVRQARRDGGEVGLTTNTRIVDGRRVTFVGGGAPGESSSSTRWWRRPRPSAGRWRRAAHLAVEPGRPRPGAGGAAQGPGPAPRRGRLELPAAPLLRPAGGPTAAVEDDTLIGLQEATDPVALPGTSRWSRGRARTNADRVVALQRRLQAWLDDDPPSGSAVLPPSFPRPGAGRLPEEPLGGAAPGALLRRRVERLGSGGHALRSSGGSSPGRTQAL